MLTSSVVNGLIYAIGGDEGGYITPTSTLEIFDPVTNKWSTPASTGVLTARFGLSSCVLNDKIFAIGGYTPHTELNIVEFFSPGQQSVSGNALTLPIEIFPNPSNGVVHVLGGTPGELHMRVSNILGETVFELSRRDASSFTFDLSKFPRGDYIASFLTGTSVTQKLIVRE